jgi:chromosome segregation ATPase
VNVQLVLQIVTVLGLPTLVGLLVHARAKNRKLNAEASHLDTEDAKVISSTALQLLAPVKEQLAETRAECDELTKQVKELTAEVEHQRQVINDTTVKLEAANRRADYYQQAFDERAGN